MISYSALISNEDSERPEMWNGLDYDLKTRPPISLWPLKVCTFRPFSLPFPKSEMYTLLSPLLSSPSLYPKRHQIEFYFLSLLAPFLFLSPALIQTLIISWPGLHHKSLKPSPCFALSLLQSILYTGTCGIFPKCKIQSNNSKCFKKYNPSAG